MLFVSMGFHGQKILDKYNKIEKITVIYFLSVKKCIECDYQKKKTTDTRKKSE